ncbi:P-loop containing nucleoside triphosphate hydrolase protein [Russula dissimulans]|nr:P-loop containing nucleoside triphosphate hydrolase protein [Russula dissimulans]
MHPIPKCDSVVFREARAEATRTRGYSSEEIRSKISSAFKDVFNGLEPYNWQLDICEALLMGLDCIVIAGTGARKTMPFIMPLLVDPTKKKMVIVISPLNALEHDQAGRFNKIGLHAMVVNRDVWTPKLEEAIVKSDYRVLLTSLEMCLEHNSFSKLMQSISFTKNIFAIVVDEARCVSQWGDADRFQKYFGELGQLRSFVPNSVPFLATSATLSLHVLADVTSQQGFSDDETLLVDLGNHRPNVTTILVRMNAAKDLSILDFLVDGALSGGSFVRSLVFFNVCELAQRGAMHLQMLLLEDRQHEVDFLHACQETRAKCKVLTEFCQGIVNILCATEAAGMGMDIPDIERVVQFAVPTSLSVLNQRAGRAGRSGQHALVILLAEPSVFQTVKKRKKPEEEKKRNTRRGNRAPVECKKKMEAGIQAWCLADGCRVNVSDKYFNNPLRLDDRTWRRDYGLCAWGPNVLLAEPVITKLAMNASLSSLEDVKHEVPDWDFASKYGTDVIEVIKGADELWKRDHEQDIQSRKQTCRRQSQENKELREEQQRQQK